MCINKLLTWCCQPPACRLLLTPNHSTGLWRLYKTWMWHARAHRHTHTQTHTHTHQPLIVLFTGVVFRPCQKQWFQTYFLHLPCLSQRDSGTLTTQEVKATHRAWLLLSICMPMMRLSSTPSILHLEGVRREDRGEEEIRIFLYFLQTTRLFRDIKERYKRSQNLFKQFIWRDKRIKRTIKIDTERQTVRSGGAEMMLDSRTWGQQQSGR